MEASDTAEGCAVLERIVSAKITGSSPVPARVLSMIRATEEVRYRGTSLGWLLRVGYHAYVRGRVYTEGSPLRSIRGLLMETAVVIRNLSRGYRWRRVVKETLAQLASKSGNVLIIPGLQSLLAREPVPSSTDAKPS